MKITINDDINLGFSHCGSVWTTAQGEFEMPDDYVETIVALIREKGTADIEELELEESHPEIYEFLSENINEIYNLAEEAHFIRRGFSEGDCYEYDDEFVAYCEDELGFKYDEEDYIKIFGETGNSYKYRYISYFLNWLCDYVETLTDKQLLDFLYEHINNGFDYSSNEYEIEIPQQIIDMAGGDEYIIFSVAEVDGDILWVNHNTSRSVDDVEEDEFSTILTNSVWLTNDEVTSIIDLIRKTKTTDVYRMNLSEIYPDIYRKIDKSIAKHLDDLDLGGLRADYNVILPQRIIDMACGKEDDNNNK